MPKSCLLRIQLETELHTPGRKPPRLEQNCWKEAAGTMAGNHTGLGVIYVPPAEYRL